MPCRGGLSEPHERDLPCREERGGWGTGEEVSGQSFQAWDDLTEGTQVGQPSPVCIYLILGPKQRSCSSDVAVCLPLQVSGGNARVSVQRGDRGGGWSSGRLHEGVPEGAPMSCRSCSHQVAFHRCSFVKCPAPCWIWEFLKPINYYWWANVSFF